MNRRELLGLFGAGVLAVRRHRGQRIRRLRFSALDHIEFYVSNAEKSRDFFVRVFGNTLLSRNNKRYLKLGATYMAFEQPRANGEIKVDHTSIAIKGLDMPKLHAFLEQRGVAYQDYPSGRDTAVVDADGIRLQLSPENGWSLLNPANFLPEEIAMTEEPIFRPMGMDHVVLNVKEPEKSVAFYQKFLGAAGTQQQSHLVSGWRFPHRSSADAGRPAAGSLLFLRDGSRIQRGSCDTPVAADWREGGDP